MSGEWGVPGGGTRNWRHFLGPVGAQVISTSEEGILGEDPHRVEGCLGGQ